MRYCAYCKRLNTGQPIFCQFCGHSFDIRICRACGHQNPPAALACRRCGRTNLSEPSGRSSIWPWLIKISFWLLAIVMALSLVKAMLANLQAFVPLVIMVGLFALSYSFLPEIAKKLIRGMLNSLKGLFTKKDDNI